jgi:phospholipid-binding lipoprotein MlaA
MHISTVSGTSAMTADYCAGPVHRPSLVVNRRRGHTCAGILLLAIAVIGCSTTNKLTSKTSTRPDDTVIESGSPETQQKPVEDRFERLNRRSYQFNRALDRKLLKPVARGYDRAVPQRLERRIRNFFVNLRAPIDIINNLLQGKFAPGFSDVGRFLLNSTAGLGGLFDPAAKLGLERHQEDFGQTLAVWGVPAGGYLVLPILGSGTLRDWGGFGIDLRSDLIARHNDSNTRNALLLWRLISNRAALLPAERALDASFDEYVFVRDAYLQHRTYEINDGAILDDDYLFLGSDDE